MLLFLQIFLLNKLCSWSCPALTLVFVHWAACDWFQNCPSDITHCVILGDGRLFEQNRGSSPGCNTRSALVHYNLNDIALSIEYADSTVPCCYAHSAELALDQMQIYF